MREESTMKYLIFYACLGLLAGAAILALWKIMHINASHHPPLAVVDMQALIKEQSHHVAKASKTKTGKVSERQLREASSRMKGVLEGFATHHHVILLNKGVVMGGELPDHTLEILALLEDGEDHP